MAKTELTRKIENVLIETYKREYGCLEVSMGFGTAKDGRVDYLVMDSKGIFKCFEIKVTKADFRSPCINSFEGHYNYYAMPEELHQEVKEEIPNFVGVFVYRDKPYPYLTSVKKARKCVLTAEKALLMTQYLARSLARDANRYYELQNDHIVPKLKKNIRELTKDRDQYQEKYHKSSTELFMLENELDLIHGENFREMISEKAKEIRNNRRKAK